MEVSKFLFEPCPCDNCPQKYKCDEEETACRAFAYFVRYGTFEDYTVRMPSKQLFHKIFKEDDKDLKNYLASLRVKDEMQKLLFDLRSIFFVRSSVLVALYFWSMVLVSL